MTNAEIIYIGRVEKCEEDFSVIRINEKFLDGLRGLEGFSHVIILYWFHLRDDPRNRSTLLVHPRGDPRKPLVGVFATRSPSRPNPIGLCVCKIIKVKKNKIIVSGLDAFVNSPIVDIKPYIPNMDAFPNAKVPAWVKGDG